MLLILIYLLCLFLYLLFVSPIGKSVIDRFTNKSKDVQLYGSGLMVPVPAYKANTVFDDQLQNDVNSEINKNKKATNISQLFNGIINDNYKLFNNLNNLIPNQSSKSELYENLYYDAKKEPKHLFATGLPKLGYYKKTNYPHY
jgi:hypothetical protein